MKFDNFKIEICLNGEMDFNDAMKNVVQKFDSVVDEFDLNQEPIPQPFEHDRLGKKVHNITSCEYAVQNLINAIDLINNVRIVKPFDTINFNLPLRDLRPHLVDIYNKKINNQF